MNKIEFMLNTIQSRVEILEHAVVFQNLLMEIHFGKNQLEKRRTRFFIIIWEALLDHQGQQPAKVFDICFLLLSEIRKPTHPIIRMADIQILRHHHLADNIAAKLAILVIRVQNVPNMSEYLTVRKSKEAPSRLWDRTPM